MKRTLIAAVLTASLAACAQQPQQADTRGASTAPPAPAPSATATTPAPSAANPADAPGTIPNAAPGMTEATAPRMMIAQLQQQLPLGNVLLLDVRPTMSYSASHAAGAVNIPLEQLQARAAELPRDKRIVAYCT